MRDTPGRHAAPARAPAASDEDDDMALLDADHDMGPRDAAGGPQARDDRPGTSTTPLLILLAGATGLGPFAMHALAPALPAVAADLNVSSAAAQLMLSGALAGMALATLFMGALSDFLGRRVVLLWALLLAALGGAAAAMAPSLEIAVAGRTVQAAAASAGMVLGRAVATDLFRPSEAAAFIAKITAAMVVMPMISPAMGGYVAEYTGWRGVVGMSVILSVVLLAWAWVAMPETVRERAQGLNLPRLWAGFAYAARSRTFWACALYSALQLASFYSFVGAAPFVMAEYGLGPDAYGLWFILTSITFLVGNLLSSRLLPTWGAERLMKIGGAIIVVGIGLAVVPVALGQEGPLWLFLPATVNGLAGGMAIPAAVGIAVAARSERAGAASSLLGFLQFVLAGLTTQLGGVIPHASALPTVLLLWLSGVLGIVLWALLRARPEADAT